MAADLLIRAVIAFKSGNSAHFKIGNRVALERFRDSDLLGGATLVYEHCESELLKAASDGEVTSATADAAVRMATFEAIRRSGRLFRTFERQTSPEDIEDLLRIVSIIPEPLTAPRFRCLLNPGFEKLPRGIPGADADLVLDDTVIEIKTTKIARLRRVHFYQVIGYAAFAVKSGFLGDSSNADFTRVGIYFARHGVLHTWPLADRLRRADGLKQLFHWLDTGYPAGLSFPNA